MGGGDRQARSCCLGRVGWGMMFGFWRHRKIQRERIRQEAETLIEKHGDAAYELARSRRVAALQQKNSAEHRFWCAVARAIADHTGRESGMDTATRYSNASDGRSRFRVAIGKATENH